MSKHTPGPWKAGTKSVTAPETEDRLGLYVRFYGGNADDNRANARLIAAAPDHHAVALELERLMLVIESAVRHSDPRNHAAVIALILANKAAVRKAVGAAERRFKRPYSVGSNDGLGPLVEKQGEHDD